MYTLSSWKNCMYSIVWFRLKVIQIDLIRFRIKVVWISPVPFQYRSNRFHFGSMSLASAQFTITTSSGQFDSGAISLYSVWYLFDVVGVGSVLGSKLLKPVWSRFDVTRSRFVFSSMSFELVQFSVPTYSNRFGYGSDRTTGTEAMWKSGHPYFAWGVEWNFIEYVPAHLAFEMVWKVVHALQ